MLYRDDFVDAFRLNRSRCCSERPRMRSWRREKQENVRDHKLYDRDEDDVDNVAELVADSCLSFHKKEITRKRHSINREKMEKLLTSDLFQKREMYLFEREILFQYHKYIQTDY